MQTPQRRTLAIIPLLLTAILSRAAAQDWTATYHPTRSESPLSVARADDGGIVIAGSTYVETPRLTGYFMAKLDRGGRVLWDSIYTHGAQDTIYPQQMISMRKGRSGEFLISGFANVSGTTGALVYAVDQNGRVIWRKGFLRPYENHAHVLIHRGTGGYFLAGHYNSSMWLVRLSEENEVLWEKTYRDDRSTIEHVHAAVETEDGGCLLAGHTTIDDQEHYHVIKTDSNGVEEWSRILGSGEENDDDPSWVVRNADGAYAIFGNSANRTRPFTNPWLLVLDPSGRVVVDAHFGAMTERTICMNGIATADGGYLLASYADLPDTVDGMPVVQACSVLIHADRHGAATWERRFKRELGTCVTEFPDAYMLVALGATSQEVVLHNIAKKVDGQDAPHADVWSYPNPATANQSVTIEVNGPVAADRELAVYDALGRRVAMLPGVEIGATKHRYFWSLGTGAAVPPGAYYYAVQGERSVLHGSTVVVESVR